MEDDHWKVILEKSLFSNRLCQLKEVCENQFSGNFGEFVKDYLCPIAELLDNIRTKCKDYYSLNRKDFGDWSLQFENIVKYGIHLDALQSDLNKGDFYIHISSAVPRTLEITFCYHGGLMTRTLNIADCTLMCSEKWTEVLKTELQDTFVYKNCIVWHNYKLKKVSWKKLLGEMSDINTAVESVTSSLNSVSINSDCEGWKQIKIVDLNIEILQNEMIYCPGSLDIYGRLIIFINTDKDYWKDPNLSIADITNVLFYLYKIPKEQSSGCVFVIDGLHSSHIAQTLQIIGKSLTLFQTHTLLHSHDAIVLLQKDSLLLLCQSANIKDIFSFTFQFISSISCLKLSKLDLPVHYDGELHYNHNDWIKFRKRVEPFLTLNFHVLTQLKEEMIELVKKESSFSSTECKNALLLHKEKSTEILNNLQLMNLRADSDNIIIWLKNATDLPPLTPVCKETVEHVYALHGHLDEVFTFLLSICNKKLNELQLSMQVCSFNEEAKQTVDWLLNEGMTFLGRHIDIADSIGHAQSLLVEFQSFSNQSEQFTSSAEENLLLGNKILNDGGISPDITASIQKEIAGLERVLKEFTSKFSERKKKLLQCLDFHTLVLQTHTWWMAGLQFIAHMNMEEIQTYDGIQRLKDSFEKFNANNPPPRESQIARITELAHHLGSKQVEQAELNNCRCLEVKEMFLAKQNQIFGAEERLRKCNWDLLISDPENDESSSGYKEDDLSTEADVEDYQESVYYEPDTSMPIYQWMSVHEHYNENDTKLAVFDAAMPAKTKERLRFIIDEMINTEHDYVDSLEYVLINYLPEMESDTLPATLKGKKNILFGNFDRIFEFHKRHFSHDIEAYRHTPLQIGKCFLKWERQFYVYAQYNKNKPRSDEIWDDFANAHFERKMIEMKDKLGLASYLIKPVQRLGKYSLLLRDMISCCDVNDPRTVEMKKAHELMKFQLRHGNDLLAMDAIKRTDVNLKEGGCLLRQADFIVWYGRRKRLRRVFLFEHMLVFTKAKRQKAQGDIFMYKHSIKTADLGLTENIGESGLKFEVWYRRWNKRRASETYILEATTDIVKDDWTKDLTQILWRQAARNKEYGLTEASTGISVESTPSSIFPEENHFNPYTRTRDLSPRSTEFPTTKRHSWMSVGESSESSGVHDMCSLPEDIISCSPRDDKFFKRGDSDYKYGSVTLRREVNNAHEGAFIRNNVYRKTFQADTRFANPAQQKKFPRRSASYRGGRYATQPIILPSSEKTKYRKVLSERPTSPESIVESVEEEPRNSPLIQKSFTQGDLTSYSEQAYYVHPSRKYSYAQSSMSMVDCRPPPIRCFSTEPIITRHLSTSSNSSDVSSEKNNRRNSKKGLSTSISTTTFFGSKDIRRSMLPNFLRKRLSRSVAELL